MLDGNGEHDSARQWLERASAADHRLGHTLLAEVLLSRTPYDVPRGISLVRRAAQAGDARAAHLLALLVAAGVGHPQNWSMALELLMAAALGGWNLAREVLAGGCSDAALARTALHTRSTDAALWKAVAERIDLRPWFTVRQAERISAEPRIAIVREFLPPGICDWMIARAKPALRPAEVYDRDSGRLVLDPYRNNAAALFPLVLSDLFLLLVRERIARVIERPASFMEQPAVLHYAPGEEYRPHWDYCDLALPGPAKDAAENGQRVLTFLIYLNEDYEGGETDFPRLRWRFRGRKGDALFWWNVGPEGKVDPQTLHAGLTPPSGEKWLFSQWVRDHPDHLYR